MSLIDYRLGETINKVDVAIQRLRAFEPDEGYFLAFSGGKDSVCIKALADMAGVKYDAHYNVTSVDPPELVQFIKTFPDVKRDIHQYKDGSGAITMWNLIPRKLMPPTRLARYCCKELKEGNGKGRVVVTGVRWAESINRRANRNLVDIGKKGEIVYNDDNDEARRTVEQCYRTKTTLVNPIIDWLTEDVWEFIRVNGIPYCGLYDEGHKRLGCIGCPMSTQAVGEFARWPKYYDSYVRAFDRMLDARKQKEKPTQWNSGEEVMDWWLCGESRDKPIQGQVRFELEDV